MIRRSCNSGFSLVEAIITVGIFGILLAVLFSVLQNFQKDYIYIYGKQNFNKQFVTVYRALEHDVPYTNSDFFTDYGEFDKDSPSGKTARKHRCIIFPLTTKGTGEDGYPIWDRIIIYALMPSDPTKCNESWEFCNHKRLVRYEYLTNFITITAETNSINTNQLLRDYKEKIDVLLNTPLNSSAMINENVSARLLRLNIIEEDINDFTVKSDDYKKIEFSLIVFNAEAMHKAGVQMTNANIESLTRFKKVFPWVTFTAN